MAHASVPLNRTLDTLLITKVGETEAFVHIKDNPAIQAFPGLSISSPSLPIPERHRELRSPSMSNPEVHDHRIGIPKERAGRSTDILEPFASSSRPSLAEPVQVHRDQWGHASLGGWQAVWENTAISVTEAPAGASLFTTHHDRTAL